MDIREKIHLRDASQEEAPFIAWAVLVAIGYKDDSEAFQKLYPAIVKLCSRDDTLYSWKRTRMACIDGTPVGCLISYDGGLYEDLLPKTWGRAGFSEDQFSEEDYSAYAIETKAGEYYLDTMAIKEAFRKAGIGKILLQDGIEIGKAKGFKRITLIAETEAPSLRKYYSELGFKEGDEIVFFGEKYTRMSLEIN